MEQRLRLSWRKWLLSTPEVLSLNPVISFFYIEHVFSVNCMEKTKIKKREAGKGPFKTNLIKLPSRSLLLVKKFR